MDILDAINEFIAEGITQDASTPRPIKWVKTNEHMDIQKTYPGDVVMFHGNGGYSWEGPEAEKDLLVGEIYAINAMSVESWRTDILLKGFGTKKFNSVLFANVQKD